MATVTKPIALDESINTTESTPRNVADVLAQELANIASAIGGGGGSGGHTIENSSGIALPQRTNLQFGSGLGVTDDAVNDATVVELTGESVHANMFVKLWENPNPTTNFASQTITLSSDDYDFLLILSLHAGASYGKSISAIVKKGEPLMITASITSTNSYITSIQREYSFTDDTHLSVGVAYDQTSNATRSENNNRLVPVIIYGFKKSLDITAIVSNVSTDATRCIMSDGVTNVEDAVEEKARKTDIATVESGSTASRAYSVGELVYVNGQLYKVITAISLGSAFTVGTNIQSTTVGAMISGNVNYSETEHVIGKWIDGSTLYEKTINTGALPNNSNIVVNHNISNLKEIISLEGVAIRPSTSMRPIPYINGSSVTDSIGVDASMTQIVVRTWTNITAYTKSYITIRYTKTV